MRIIYFLLVTTCIYFNGFSKTSLYHHCPEMFKDTSKIVIYIEEIANALRYELTEDSLRIVYMPETEGGKDSVIFQTSMPDKQGFKRLLLNKNIDTLKESYSNNCIADGLVLNIVFVRGNKEKSVNIGNCYLADIAPVIKFLNGISPESLKIWYDKEILLKMQQDCK